MKTLTIVRHGKSTWDYSGINDIDRPLKERGINDAYEMAKRLEAKNFQTDLLISSPASRAISTATIFCSVLHIADEKIRINSDLFHSDVEEIMNIIYSAENEKESMMIFGHNPGFTDLANYLSSPSISNIPTAGIVILEFDCMKWSEIDKTNCKSRYFDYPKNK